MSFNASYVLNDKINTEITKSKVEIIQINKNNLPSSFYTNGFFEPRDTVNKLLYLDHASIGVFERAIGLRNTLDTTVTLAIKAVVNAGDGDKTGATIWEGTVPKDARWFFLSDKGDFDKGTTVQKNIGVLELRLPFPKFIIEIKANAVPTTGEIMLEDIRRY